MLHIETRLAVRKTRLPNSRRFSIGAAERSSTQTSAPSATNAATPVPIMTGLVQPRSGDSLTRIQEQREAAAGQYEAGHVQAPRGRLTVLGQVQQLR